MSVAQRLRPQTTTRRWVGPGAAALVWLALYQVNLPFGNWVVFDIAGLDPASRLGSGVHFFFYDTVKIGLLLVGIISPSPLVNEVACSGSARPCCMSVPDCSSRSSPGSSWAG